MLTASSWRWAAAAFALAACLYGQPDLLNGDFVYDDGGSVLGNSIVTGARNLSDLWVYDFWAERPLSDPKSHKSWRPLTTLTYYWNFAHWQGGRGPFVFHVTNVLLHAAVSALVVPTVALSMRADAATAVGDGHDAAASADALAGFAALLFAAHPIHAEAVQNITGRAEILMALFFLAGFVSYASAVRREQDVRRPSAAAPPAHRPPTGGGAQDAGGSPLEPLPWWKALPSIRVWTLGLAPTLALTVAAMLCKETGVTLPVLCVAWDYFVASRLTLRCLGHLVGASARAGHESTTQDRIRRWGWRSLWLAIGTVAIAAWRQSLNGGSAPHLRYNQNRIAIPRPPDGADVDGAGSATPPFSSIYVAGFWRGCSIAWLWIEYAWSVMLPRTSSADWSCRAIPALGDVYSPGWYDSRLPLLALLAWICIATTVRAVQYAEGWRFATDRGEWSLQTRPEVLMAGLWAIVPFILSSNLLFPIGTTKAERVIYLPSLGWCIFVAHCLVAPQNAAASSSAASRKPPRRQRLLGRWGVLVLTLAAYGHRTVVRSREWRSSVELWEAAYRTGEARGHVTPHTLQNYGFAKAWAGDHEGAVYLMERFESMSRDELGEQAFNVESALVLELRLVGRLDDAEARARATISRVIEKRKYRRQAGIKKDESGPLRLQARATAALALCKSHRSLNESANLMYRATTMIPSDSMTSEMSRGLDAAFYELQRFNKELGLIQLGRRDYIGHESKDVLQLEALPYAFEGYEDLPGNQGLLKDPATEKMTRHIIKAGLGERGLVGGGASGHLGVFVNNGTNDVPPP